MLGIVPHFELSCPVGVFRSPCTAGPGGGGARVGVEYAWEEAATCGWGQHGEEQLKGAEWTWGSLRRPFVASDKRPQARASLWAGPAPHPVSSVVAPHFQRAAGTLVLCLARRGPSLPHGQGGATPRAVLAPED